LSVWCFVGIEAAVSDVYLAGESRRDRAALAGRVFAKLAIFKERAAAFITESTADQSVALATRAGGSAVAEEYTVDNLCAPATCRYAECPRPVGNVTLEMAAVDINAEAVSVYRTAVAIWKRCAAVLCAGLVV